MPDHTEAFYSRDIFVPREIVFELLTEVDHLNYWWGEGTYTIVEKVPPSCVVYLLPGSAGDNHTGREVTLQLHDLADCARIDFHQTHLTDADAIRQAVTEWQKRLAALENYLSSI